MAVAIRFLGGRSNGRDLLLHYGGQLRAHRALCTGLLQALGVIEVDLMYLLGGVLSLGLFVYLLIAMLFPERFA